MIVKIVLLILAIFNTTMSIFNNNLGNETLGFICCVSAMIDFGIFIGLGFSDAINGKGFWN